MRARGRRPGKAEVDAACARVREGDFAGAARALSRGRARLDLGAVLRNDPRNDLMYSELPRSSAPTARRRAAWAGLARRGRRAELWALAGASELASGHLEAALRYLGRALRRDPRLREAALLRAAARLLYGSFVRRRRASRWLLGALTDLDGVLAARPDDARARRLRGEARKDLQDHRGAREDLEEAIRLAPDNEWPCVELAELLCDTGRFNEAWPLLRRLESRHGNKGWYWALCGRACATSGRLAEGLECLERAVELSPGKAPILAWRGEALRKAGRCERALGDFTRAIALDPEFAYAYEWRGRLLLAMRRPREALADLQQVARKDPRHFSGLVLRGEAFFKLGDFRRAAADFDSVYPLDPRTTWTPALDREGPAREREEEYWSDLDGAVRDRPGDAWALALRGRARAVAGAMEEGVADLRSALACRDLSYARAWFGFALLETGAAREALDALCGVRGRWPAAWRGRALTQLDRPREALAEFDRAVQRDDSLVARVHEWRAAALRACGRTQEAGEAAARAGRWLGLARGEGGRRAAGPAVSP